MEYVIFAGTAAVIVLVYFVIEWFRSRREEKKFIKKLYEDYLGLSDKEYSLERFVRMDSYFVRHTQPGQIDDITWNDLGMDELFKRMNYTLSASGEEYLYYTLRTLKQNRQEIEHLEEVVKCVGENPDLRIKTQLKLRRLGYTGKYSIYEYLEHLDILGERSSLRILLLDFLFLPFIGMLWINPTIGILGLLCLTIYNISSYFSQKKVIDPYITSFSYVVRLMSACEEIEKLEIPVYKRELEELRKHRKRLMGIDRNSCWVLSPTRGNTSMSDVLGIFMDYIRMVFHVDILKFNSMLKCLRGHFEDVDALIGIVGYLEAAISIWIFRQSLENGFCLPQFVEESCVDLEEGYHPLLEKPVKNSIHAKQGVLLTGSNASGKSTFLKTVAVNAILAQTVNTCLSNSYRAPFFHVYSSMALRDDMGSGESYYIVEIKALKRILDAAAECGAPVLCFVDEVLRGTNTVERIAASAQILESLSGSGILCFAATHDIELTDLLAEDFSNYHFEEDVRDGDIYFNYKLQSGKATTRNAIKLLELMGYDSKIIEKASAQAEHFIREGVWEMHS